MQKTTGNSNPDFKMPNQIPFSSLSTAEDPIWASWSHGCGSPHPATPLSESRYDGEKLFDDCEPWIL